MECTRKPLAGYPLRRPGAAALAWFHARCTVVAGANAAVFSLINILMFPMLPVREPQQLFEFLVLYPGDPPLNVFSWHRKPTGTVCLVLPMFHNLLLGAIFFCLNLLDRCMESEYL